MRPKRRSLLQAKITKPRPRPRRFNPPVVANGFAPGLILAIVLLIALLAVSLPFAMSWINYRRTHSITDDAFVEAHIINVGPQVVSGRVVRYLVDENDRVEQGQVLAEVDPIPYRDKVNVARAQLDAAQAELARQRADLDRVRKEVPIQIEIARRTFAAAEADRAKAEESLKLTRDEVEKGIDEARAGVKAAQASLTLAELEYTRFTRLEQQGASTPQRQQQVTQSRDSAVAQVDLAEARLAKAVADLTQIDVARRTLEAAQKAEQKAAKGIDLAETGNDQIRELELLVKVKEQTVEQARRALEAAENDLAYTQVRAPFPGVVVKRYRHLGDFVAAGSPLLSMYNPESALRGGQPGGGSLARGRAWQPGSHRARRLRRAVPRAGRLGQQVDRGPVRAHAAERRLGRVHSRGSARAGADPDRARRPLAATPRRAVWRRWPSRTVLAMPPGPRRRHGR